MHLLLVNDDGFGAPGIEALLKAAVKRGHKVTLVAPRTQQSAMSHRLTLTEPLFLEEKPSPYENCRLYTLSGSPTDCLRVGVRALADTPVDAVLSGINYGYNAGIAAQYSGTVGAALEAAYNYLPGIAVSASRHAGPEVLSAAADYAVRKAEKLADRKLPRSVILNINAPKDPWIGEKYCPLGDAYFEDSYERRVNPKGGVYFWLDDSAGNEPPQPGTDEDWLEKGYLTLTLLGGLASLPEEEYGKLDL